MVATADLNSLTGSSINSMHAEEEKKRSELDAENIMRLPGAPNPGLREERRSLLTSQVNSDKYSDRVIRPDGFGAKKTSTLERVQAKHNLKGEDLNKIRSMGIEMPMSGALMAS